MGKSGPLERARLANQIQGFRIPNRGEAEEKINGKMNQILRCDWLPERARWSSLARSGHPVLSRKKNFPESHIINPLLTKCEVKMA